MAARHRVTAGRHLGAGNLVRLTQDFWVYENPCPSGNCNEGPTCDNNDPDNCCDDILDGTDQGGIDNNRSAEDVLLAGGTAHSHQTNGGVEIGDIFALGAINLLVPSHTQILSENRKAHNDAAVDHAPVMNISHNLAYARYRKGMKVHDPMPNVTYKDMKKIIGLTPAMSMGDSSGHITSLQTKDNSGGIDHSFDDIQPDVIEDSPSLSVDPRRQSKFDIGDFDKELQKIQDNNLIRPNAIDHQGEYRDFDCCTIDECIRCCPNHPCPQSVACPCPLVNQTLCPNEFGQEGCGVQPALDCPCCPPGGNPCTLCGPKCVCIVTEDEEGCGVFIECDCPDDPCDCTGCDDVAGFGCGCDENCQCIASVIEQCECGQELCSTCTRCPTGACPDCEPCACNGTRCGEEPEPCAGGCGDPCDVCETPCDPETSCDTCPSDSDAGKCRTLDCVGECGGPGCDGKILCCPDDGDAGGCQPCPPCPDTSGLVITGSELTSLKGNYRGKDLVPIAYFNHDLNVGLDHGSANGSAVGPRDTVMSCVLELTIADVYGRIPVTGAAPYVKPLKLTVYKSNKAIDTSTVSCDLYSTGNDWTSDSGRNATDRNLTAVSSITIGEDVQQLDKIQFDLTSLARDAVQNNEGVMNFMIEASEWFDESTGLKAAPLAEQPAMLLRFYREGTHRPKVKTNVNQGLRPATQRLNPATMRRRAITAGL